MNITDQITNLKVKSNCWTMVKNIFHHWLDFKLFYLQSSNLNRKIKLDENIVNRRSSIQQCTLFVAHAFHFIFSKKKCKKKTICKTKGENANYKFKMVAFILLIFFCVSGCLFLSFINMKTNTIHITKLDY